VPVRWGAKTMDEMMQGRIGILRVDYKIGLRQRDSLSPDELESCCAIVRCGGAVDPESAETQIPKATAVVIAQAGNQIVGVGVIKRRRQKYATGVAAKSGFKFDPKILELWLRCR